MMQVTFYKKTRAKTSIGDVVEELELLGISECDVTPFKNSPIKEENIQTHYTSKTETKAFIYEHKFYEADTFKAKGKLFEIKQKNDYNDENILCFIGVCYERN